jgi:thiol peroxidase
MAKISLRGNPIETSGELPAKGAAAPAATLTSVDMKDMHLTDYPGKKVLNIFPSIDTPVCQASVRRFNIEAAAKPGVHVLNISADLPFAHKRFCAAEGIDKVVSLSTFRSSFARDYGLAMSSGPLSGLCARAVIVLDENNKVVYTELVPEIAQEPNYQAALAAL